jgi:hypothetical protein
LRPALFVGSTTHGSGTVPDIFRWIDLVSSGSTAPQWCRSCEGREGMDYLIDCECGHDLTRHDDSGCVGSDRKCHCGRTKLQALDAAIDVARVNPWAGYVRKGSAGEEIDLTRPA